MGALQEKFEDIKNDLSEDPFTSDPFKSRASEFFVLVQSTEIEELSFSYKQ